MLFNTLEYAIFFIVVFTLYWFVFNKNLKLQNAALLLSSYFFYACWDWRFLALLIFSTVLDYFSGLKIAGTSNKTQKKTWFLLSIIINLGFLGVFKYYNFFISSFAQIASKLGLNLDPPLLSIVLPVGISFYTFHGLSYVIDIYKGRIKEERSFVDYAVFVTFFPLLVAGPIERATHLLPQVKQKRVFEYEKATSGFRQILWGLFKKVVIADQCAKYVTIIFGGAAHYTGSTLAMGAVLFAFQIYGDFSGYSDIAMGTAKLLGFDLLRNFAYPYFSRDIAEFWRRWHISLSSWFRDYLYIPLGGSKGNAWVRVRNTFIVFLVSGLWHGANWTFIIWGALNALFILPLVIFNKNRANLNIVAEGRLLPTIRELLSVCLTFALTCFAWIFFRAESLDSAIHYVSGIFTRTLFTKPQLWHTDLITLIIIFVVVEWMGREQPYAIANLRAGGKKVARYLVYYLIIFSIFWFSGKKQQFIYFQF